MSVRIHWLAFTLHGLNLDQVIKLVAEECCLYAGEDPGQLFQVMPNGGNGYEGLLKGWNGIKVYHTPGRADVHVVVPGQACEFTYAWRLLRLASLGKLTRIDVALDGVKGPDGQDLSPSWVYELCVDHPEQVRTWANIKPDLTVPADERSSSLEFHVNAQGETCGIGAKSSDRKLRIYNKRGFTRIELEVTGKRANVIGECLALKKEESLPFLVVGLIRDFIDFVEPGGRNKARAPLQAWWQAVCDGVSKIRVAVPEQPRTLEEKRLHFEQQYAPTLAMIFRSEGGSLDWFLEMVAKGEARMTAKHRHLLDLFEHGDLIHEKMAYENCEKSCLLV